MQCSFSLTQIGEFAFILATLGTSLGVTSDFLYPIVVAVSVFTTFTTPYMIRLAEPAYMMVARTLPAKWMARLERNKDESDEKAPDELQQMYDRCFKHFVFTMLINSVLCIAIMSIMYYYGQSLIASLVPESSGVTPSQLSSPSSYALPSCGCYYEQVTTAPKSTNYGRVDRTGVLG